MASNQNFNLTGTAIGEFEFSVLAISFLKYWKTLHRMFQQVKLTLDGIFHLRRQIYSTFNSIYYAIHCWLWVTLFVNFRWNKFYNVLCYIPYGETWLDKRIRIWVYLLDFRSCYHYRNHSSLYLLLMKNTDIEVRGIIAIGIGIQNP